MNVNKLAVLHLGIRGPGPFMRLASLSSMLLAAGLALGCSLADNSAALAQEAAEPAQPAQPQGQQPAEEQERQEPLEQPQPGEPQAAQPKQETSPEADAAFAKSFVGKTYQGDLDIQDWDDLGGGLILPPIYIRQYQRADGTFLVLTSREVAPPTRTTPASYVVADALIVPKPKEGVEFTIACVQGEDETLRFIGEASGNEDKEWWTDVRKAWEISIETGAITEAKTKSMRCTNISWGQ